EQSFGLDGSGISVAIIDSGINDSHEDLQSNRPGNGNGGQSRVIYSQNFVEGESTTKDLFGHGTHVAGIVAGDGTASSGKSSYRSIKGIATRANLVNFRVLNAQGEGSESAAIAAIERAITLKTALNIKVINLSIGTSVLDSYLNDPLCRATDL